MKKSTLFLIILVAIFFTSTLVLIKLNYLQPQPIYPPKSDITPTVAVDPLADWKTYENKEFSFSFQYPSTLSVNKIIPNIISIGTAGKEYSFEGSRGAPIEIYFSKNKENLTLDQYINSLKNMAGWGTFTKTKFKGYDAYIETPQNSTTSTFVIKDGYLIQFTFSTFSEDGSNFPVKEIYDQILSTFKFTNTISDPTLGWKKFGSMSYDISFKYPQDWSVETENMTIFLKSPKTIAALSNKNNTWTRVGDLIISSLTQKSLPNNQNNLPLSSWITSNYSANPIHNITLAGMNGFKVTSCGDICLEEIYLEDENVIYKIDSGNSDHFTTELNQILSTLTSSNSPSLIQPGQQSPVAGICQEVSKNQEVTIIISPDNVPVPRCVEVTSGQKLKITNNSPNSIEIYQTNPKTIIKSGVSFVFSQAVGAFLEPGIHSIAGAEIWLQ